MNTWFQFKQFIIRQDKCAMKVCTDACLFGAVAADKILHKEFTPKHILDIGSGTGLLSLMLSQITDAAIDVVEIEDNAFQQAKENFEENNKDSQISAHHTSIEFFQTEKKFDLIITNPPFYQNQLQSPSVERNMAMHTEALTFKLLSSSLKRLLKEKGTAAILLPYSEHENFTSVLSNDGLYVNERIQIRHSITSALFRTILLCSFRETVPQENYIAIKNEENLYTEKFKSLLHPFYLNL